MNHEKYNRDPGIVETLDIPLAENAQTSTTKPRPVIHSGFDDKFGQELQVGYK